MNLLEKLDQESDVVDELRHHLELVLEGFIGGSLDSSPIAKLCSEQGYERIVDEFKPKLNECFVTFLSSLLYALKTSLIDIELIDDRSYDLSSAHERLKNTVNSLRSSTKQWLKKLPVKPKLNPIYDLPVSKSSLKYEDTLAIGCINKVLMSSLKECDSSLEEKLNEEYSYESTTSVTVYCNRDEWKTDDAASESKKFLKKFCAASGGGVPFPEYGVDIVDKRWKSTEKREEADGSEKAASVAMASTEWEDNWLFSKKKSKHNGTFNLEPVHMVIPKPKERSTVKLGSLDLDTLSELSENNSVASLEFSSSDSESDRPQITGAVMKSQVKPLDLGTPKVTIADLSLESPSPSGTTIVKINVSDRDFIEKWQSNRLVIQDTDVTAVTERPPGPKKIATEDEKPLMGPRAKASYDGRVVMENIEDVKDNNFVYIKGADMHKLGERRTPLGVDAVSYDELSVQAFQEETLKSLENRFDDFDEHMNNTRTTSSLRSFSEEDLDVPNSVSTDFSFRRSPEGCSTEPLSKPNTPNITSMFIGKSSSPEMNTKHNVARPTEIINSTQKIHSINEETATEEMVSVSISSGRGSTASTASASSVQSYELQREFGSRLSETSIDRDRSISAEPATQVIAVGQQRTSDIPLEEKQQPVEAELQNDVINSALPPPTGKLEKASATAIVKSAESAERHEDDCHKSPELDRDQDIYCVLPSSKVEKVNIEKMEKVSPKVDNDDIELRLQRFQSSTLPNPKRRQNRNGLPVPAKRNLLKLNFARNEVDIFASSQPTVDTITVPKNRRSFNQVFPRSPLDGPDFTLPECEEPDSIPVKTNGTSSFGVQIYPKPDPQPRHSRSSGGLDGVFARSLSTFIESAQDVDVTSMKKTVIEKDLEDKLPNVRRLASQFREPVRPGDYQSATLPAPSRRRRDNSRKDSEISKRLSYFDSYS